MTVQNTRVEEMVNSYLAVYYSLQPKRYRHELKELTALQRKERRREPKLTYIEGKNKRMVREFLLEGKTFTRVVGLAGPDINEYINFMSRRGIKEFDLYENNPLILSNQLSTLRTTHPIQLHYRGIESAKENEEGTLYDLDFCGSVATHTDVVKKFRSNFIMTFSTRIGVAETIDEFFFARKEEIRNRYKVLSTDTINCKIIDSSGGEYLFVTYKDTSAMCVFAKFS